MANLVCISGNLTRDVENYQTNGGDNFCKFTVAVERYKRGDNSKTDFVPVIAWREVATACGKYLQKGSKVLVVGSLEINTYEKDGVKHSATQVTASKVEFMSKYRGDAEQEKPTLNALPTVTDDEDDGVLPF